MKETGKAFTREKLYKNYTNNVTKSVSTQKKYLFVNQL